MLRPLLKVTFIAWIWQNYRHLLASTLVLFVCFWLINRVHQDYLNYLALKGSDAGVGLSFIIKWAAVVASITLYYFFNAFWGARKSRKSPSKTSTSWFSGTDKHKESPTDMATSSKRDKTDTVPDPFDQFRGNKKLRSRSEITVEKKGREN